MKNEEREKIWNYFRNFMESKKKMHLYGIICFNLRLKNIDN